MQTTETIYEKLKKVREKNGEVEFQAEVTQQALETYIAEELEHVASNLELPGFRKGKVPAHIIRERTDEMAILEGAAEHALRDAVREIVANENLSIVGSPRLTITKIAPKNPIEFKVMLALYPEIKLPDYKKIGAEIAGRKDDIEVTEKDIDDAILRIRTMTGIEALTDEAVAKFGPFKTLDEFKVKLKENILKDKEIQAKETRREEIMQEIVKKSKVQIPELLLDEEWYGFEEQRNTQLEAAKLSLEDYVKQNNKTKEELEKQERSLIEERIKTSMVFREIKKAENITAPEKEIQTNIAHLKLRYPDRDEAWLRDTAEALIIQEKIFTLLGLPIGNLLG